MDNLELKIPEFDPTFPPLPTAFDILHMELPDPVWIVPGYIPAGMTILAARPKIGKSWLAMQISLAVVSGGRVFDQVIDPGRILYLALEDPVRRLQSRLKIQGWTDEHAKNATFLVADQFRKYIGYLNKGGTQRLRALVEADGYRLVVIDTMERAFTGIKDINNSQDVTAALAPLHDMANAISCGILIIDHHNKPKGFNPNPVDDVSASTAKVAVADTIFGIYVENGKRGARMKADGREIEQIDKHIFFDKLTGTWQVEGDTDKIELSEKQGQIITALKALGKSKASAIASYLNENRGNTSQRLSSMFVNGLISQEIIGGIPFYSVGVKADNENI